jgi:F-box-like
MSGVEAKDFLGFPKDVARLILLKLDTRNWRQTARVCKAWQTLANDDLLWTKFYEKEVGLYGKENLPKKFKEIYNIHQLFADPINLVPLPFTHGGALKPATSAISLEEVGMPYGIASTHENEIRLWDTNTRTCQRTISCTNTDQPHRLLSFLTDKKEARLISLHTADQNQIRVWDLTSGDQVDQLSINGDVDDIAQWVTDSNGHELVVLQGATIQCFSPTTLQPTRSRTNLNHLNEETCSLLTSSSRAWVVYNDVLPRLIDRDSLGLVGVQQRGEFAMGIQVASWKGREHLIYGGLGHRQGKAHMEEENIRFCPHHGRLADAASRHPYLLLRCCGGELLAARDDKRVRLLGSTEPESVGHQIPKPKITLFPPNGPLVFTHAGSPVLLQHQAYGRLKRIGRAVIWGDLTNPTLTLTLLLFATYSRLGWYRLIPASAAALYAHDLYTKSRDLKATVK